jgi:hypothetical protein
MSRWGLQFQSKMMNGIVEKLQLEINGLRDLALSLCHVLLRNIELDPPKYRRNSTRDDVEARMSEARLCFRCIRLPGLDKEVATALEKAANELWARAIVSDATTPRDKWEK